MRSGFALLGLALAALAPAAASAQSTGSVRLVPHRAVYDLSLARAAGSSRSIDSASGRIAFDFGGDACDGYTLKYRQVTVLESGESGQRTLLVVPAPLRLMHGLAVADEVDGHRADASPVRRT